MGVGKDQSIEIIGAGPNGDRVMLLDRNGIADANSRLVYHAQDIAVQLVQAAGTAVSQHVWICHEGIWQVSGVESIISASGGASAAAQVEVSPQATALDGGTDQLTAALDLQETAPDRQTGTLIASPTNIFPGDCVAIVMSGTVTSLVACISIQLKKVG